MGFFGSLIGKELGKFAGGGIGQLVDRTGGRKTGEDIGSAIGDFAGGLLPFKKGGRVKRTGPALLHRGEFVLPSGVKPTKAQVKAVGKRKRRRPRK